jgi:small ligand-binding sensory domain FIST
VLAGGSLVLAPDPGEAGSQAAREALASLGNAAPEFGVLFASGHFLDSAADVLAGVISVTGPLPLAGCVAEAVAGAGREIESGPAVSLLLAAEAGPAETYSMSFLRTSSGGAFGGYRIEPGVHLMFCDPFSFPADALLTHLNASLPGAVVMGGMASGGAQQRDTRLFLDGKVVTEGAVGIWLGGAELRPLVSQGCRPVGDPYTVTAAEGSVLYELGGLPPLTRLRELASTLSADDAELLARGLQLGIVMDEYRTEQVQGDFLVRSVTGADPDSGAVVVGDDLEIGQTVQFHVRDAASADADLRRALEREAASLREAPAGALLFTCNARGSRLFGEPDHDAGLIAKILGDIPLAGFASFGELGPVGGKNFLHTFTASLALFP